MLVAVGCAAVYNPHLHLENYSSNLLRLGYTDQELNDGGTDTLIDAPAAQPDPASTAGALSAHLGAGTDHVCARTTGRGRPLPTLRALAQAHELS